MNQKQGLSAGSKLAHYRIVSKLGAGGMGEVYLAQDTKLDRKVALKILPAGVASDQDRMTRLLILRSGSGYRNLPENDD